MTGPPERNSAPQPSPRGRAPTREPKVTRRPWTGYTGHDMARAEPLPRCPKHRCRRAKACLAALDNLYCQRTHHSLAEQRLIHLQDPVQRELDSVPEVDDDDDLNARVERIAALAQIRRAHDADMLGLWKAGALSHRFGPYKACGVVLKPPPRAYVDLPGDPSKTRVDKPPERTYRPRHRPRFRGAERP